MAYLPKKDDVLEEESKGEAQKNGNALLAGLMQVWCQPANFMES